LFDIDVMMQSYKSIRRNVQTVHSYEMSRLRKCDKWYL